MGRGSKRDLSTTGGLRHGPGARLRKANACRWGLKLQPGQLPVALRWIGGRDLTAPGPPAWAASQCGQRVLPHGGAVLRCVTPPSHLPVRLLLLYCRADRASAAPQPKRTHPKLPVGAVPCRRTLLEHAREALAGRRQDDLVALELAAVGADERDVRKRGVVVEVVCPRHQQPRQVNVALGLRR